MFEKILEWSKLTLRQRFNFLMGLQLVVLGSVIIALWNAVDKKQSEKDQIRLEASIREAALETKLDACNQQKLIYISQNEKELRELLFEAYKIKRRNESDKNE